MTTPSPTGAANGLSRWMRLVGVFYVFLGILNSPIGQVRTFIASYAEPGTRATEALVDWHFVWAVDIGLVGAFLLFASRDPWRYRILAWLVIAQELLRGIGTDLYFVARGFYEEPVYIGFMVLHAVIIITGVLFLRREGRAAGAPASEALRDG